MEFKLYAKLPDETIGKSINLADILPCETSLYIMCLYQFHFIKPKEAVMIQIHDTMLVVYPIFYETEKLTRMFQLDDPAKEFLRVKEELARAGFLIKEQTPFSWIIMKEE